MPASQLFRIKEVRITVSNCVKLEELQEIDDVNEADAINRAMAVYHEVRSRIAKGQILAFVTREGDDTQFELLRIIE